MTWFGLRPEPNWRQPCVHREGRAREQRIELMQGEPGHRRPDRATTEFLSTVRSLVSSYREVLAELLGLLSFTARVRFPTQASNWRARGFVSEF